MQGQADKDGMTGELEGRFPFGEPSRRCEPGRVRNADAFLLGVYSSALHVRWTHPDYRVAALAVDQEPYPFWDGADETKRVERWRSEVGWQPEWGTAQPVGRLNGSSGRKVQERILTPLGLDPQRVWTTDAVPFFHVHRGRGTQGEAMAKRYDAFAKEYGLPLHQLPDRPPADQLIRRAVEEEGERLRTELQESEANLVITLGNEALAVIASLVGSHLPHQLSSNASYGTVVRSRLQGRDVDVLPLVHPGQRSSVWTRAHEGWERSCQ